MDIKYWLTPSAIFYPAPKSTKDKNPQAMPRVGTGTCDGKSGEKSEHIFKVKCKNVFGTIFLYRNGLFKVKNLLCRSLTTIHINRAITII